MRILGIDPGSRKTGFAIIESEGRKIRYIDSGVLAFEKIADFNERLGEVVMRSLELIEQYRPDEIAFESLIYVKSPTALIKLAQTRGAMIGSFAKTHAARIFEYAPNLVKSSVTGHGHATKEGVQKSIDLLVGKRDYKTSDESDAMAIAVCHLLNRGKNQLVASKGRSLKSLARKK